MMLNMAEQKSLTDYWTTVGVMKNIFEKKVCLAKTHSPNACEGKIISAHTIPHSQLRRIAIDGHVYAMAATPADIARNGGTLSAKKHGIRDFSTLNCFCAGHDNNIFAHLEDDALVFDSHQITLLHYRVLASELYRRVASYHTTLHLVDEQTKKKGRNQKKAIEYLKASAIQELLAIRDIGTSFDRCSKNLFAANYDDVSALVVHFKKLPSVMTAGSFLPQYDYDGKPLQLIYDDETLAQTVSFNILASDNHATLVMLWFANHDLIKPFADSFIAQSSKNYAALAIQTAFEYLENTCMQPAWWESEKPVVQRLLIGRMQGGSNIFEKRRSDCLTFCGVMFDQWEYDSHKFLNIPKTEKISEIGVSVIDQLKPLVRSAIAPRAGRP
jgi:hypothetical protein